MTGTQTVAFSARPTAFLRGAHPDQIAHNDKTAGDAKPHVEWC
jgi:hypothetical protein